MRFTLKNIRNKDVFISLLILFVSFAYYMTFLIPFDLKELDLLFFKIGNSGFGDIRRMMTYTKMKILIIIFSYLWYFTCTHWWKSSILVITTIELLKLISAFNPNLQSFDEIEYFSSLPITLPIVFLLIYFSNKLNKYGLAKEIRSKIDSKIDILFNEIHRQQKNKLKEMEEKFLELKSKKNSKKKDEYLKELIALRNECYKE